MADMWRSRAPPTPLEFDGITSGTFVLEKSTPAANGHQNGVKDGKNGKKTNGTQEKSGSAATEALLNGAASSSAASTSAAGLKDQRALSLRDNLDLFVARCVSFVAYELSRFSDGINSTEKLAARLRAGEDTISFDKDDDDTLDFVTAAANLRSAAYGILGKSRWEVKGQRRVYSSFASRNSCHDPSSEMAGNIIPAIATTNAIIAGLIVLQALHLLRKSYNSLRNVHVQFKPIMPLSTINLCPPNPSCGVCRDTYTELLCDPSRATLGEVVNGLLGEGEGDEDGTGPRDVSVYEDKRVLSDPDWDENNERTLESLNVTRGKFLSIVDEDGEWGTIQVAIGALPCVEPLSCRVSARLTRSLPRHRPNNPADGPAFILPSPLPKPPRKIKTTPPTLKRSAPDDDDDDIVVESTPKRPRTDSVAANVVPFTPRKKRRLDEEGLLLLDNANDKIDEEDVIEID